MSAQARRSEETRIVLQVGSSLRLRNNGEVKPASIFSASSNPLPFDPGPAFAAEREPSS
jgi:hypothetical protein